MASICKFILFDEWNCVKLFIIVGSGRLKLVKINETQSLEHLQQALSLLNKLNFTL